MKKDGLAEKAKEIQNMLKNDFVTDYDQSGTVGKLNYFKLTVSVETQLLCRSREGEAQK